MRFFEECIGRDVNEEDSFNLEGKMKVSHNSDKEKNRNVQEDGINMSHAKEESILELKDTELTTRISQGAEGQLWNDVKEKEEIYAGIDKQHSDEVFERNQVESELLNYMLEASEHEKGIANIDRRMSQIFTKTKAYNSLLNYVMLTNIQINVSEYVTAARELESSLISESKFANKEQQLDIAEEDNFKDTHEVWVAAISTTISGEISRIITEVEAKKDERSNQQFKYERTTCSEMQWQSNKINICYQYRIELQEANDELWDLMRVPKKTYNRYKQVIHCKVGWRVNNVEGKDSRALHHKVWKPGRLQPKRDEDNEAYGQQQTKVWDPRGFPFNL